MTKAKTNIENLTTGVLAAARIRFRGQASRVWFAFEGAHCKALIVNTTTKAILMDALAKGGQREALEALRKKISPDVRPTRDTGPR